VLDTVHIKAVLALSENTADNGGVAIAYDAFKLTQQEKIRLRLMDLHQINTSFVDCPDMEGEDQRCISEDLCEY